MTSRVTPVVAAPAPPLTESSQALPTRPFMRQGLLERLRPFAAVAAVAALLTAIAPLPDRTALLWAGAGLTLLAVLAGIALSWGRLPPTLDLIPPLTYVLAVAVLRHAGGGAGSGLVPLYALPIIWVALYGSRRDIVVVVAIASAATIYPIIAFGSPEYPPSEWRRALLNGAIGLLVGITVSNLVGRLRQAISADHERSADMAAAEARNRAMVLAANDAIVTLDPSGEILDVNPAALAMFRASREDLVGRDLIETLAVPEEQEFLRRGMERITVEQDPTAGPRFRTALYRVNGEAFPAEVSVGVVRDGERWVIHAFAQDISDRVRGEAEARRQLVDLESLLVVGRELLLPDGPSTARTRICAAALSVGDAATVLLFEPIDEDLVVTASAGRSPGIERLPIAGEESGTATTYRTGEPLFAGSLATDRRVSPRATAISRAEAGYWQPIRGRTGIAGVLVVLWDEPLEELDPRVQTVLNILASQAAAALEMNDLVVRLEMLAREDGLTGLANRRTLDETLEIELARASRSERPLSVVMLDLDHFKAYNDAHGHQAGDVMLAAAARAWERELRPSDLLARYGGEEFTAVLPDCPAEHALAVAERLRAATPSGITASAGIATAGPDEPAVTLIRRADAALYAAKRNGRNRAIQAPPPG